MDAFGTGPGRGVDDIWAPPTAPRRSRPRPRALAVHVIGAVSLAAALGLGLVATVILLFMTSYTGDGPSAGQRFVLFFGLVVVSSLVTAVPVFTGVIARQVHTAAIPWFVVAVVIAFQTFGIAFTTHPFPGGTTLYF